MTQSMRSILLLTALLAIFPLGCSDTPAPKYGREAKIWLPGQHAQVWAVAPAINLSGEKEVDALLQADILFQQLQQVRGLTIVPVNRVIEVYAALHLDKIESQKDAQQVCQLLGCDAIVVPTITIYDPYVPPKIGASLQLFFGHPEMATAAIDPRQLSEQASAASDPQALPRRSSFVQAADIYDAQNGSVRDRLADYVAGRYDPAGPLLAKEYLTNMDRFTGFAYHDLIANLLSRPQLNPM